MNPIVDGRDDMIHPIGRRQVVSRIFGKTTTRPRTINITECLRGVESELIWADADDGAITLMQRPYGQVVLAPQDSQLGGDAGDRP